MHSIRTKPEYFEHGMRWCFFFFSSVFGWCNWHLIMTLLHFLSLRRENEPITTTKALSLHDNTIVGVTLFFLYIYNMFAESLFFSFILYAKKRKKLFTGSFTRNNDYIQTIIIFLFFSRQDRLTHIPENNKNRH